MYSIQCDIFVKVHWFILWTSYTWSSSRVRECKSNIWLMERRWTGVFLLITRLTSSWKSRILITDLNYSKINMITLHLLLLFSCSRRRCMIDGYKLYLVKWVFSQSSMSKRSKVIIDVKDQYCCIQLFKVSRSIQYLGQKYLMYLRESQQSVCFDFLSN